MGRLIKTLVPALVIFLFSTPVYGATAVQNVTVTVPESVEIVVLWNGTEQGDAFTLTAMVQPGGDYIWQGGPEGLQIKSLSNTPIDLYIKAEGNLQGPETIPIENLKYSNYGINLPETPLTTRYTLVRRNWTAKKEIEAVVPVDIHLTVPPFTAPGEYRVRVYHIAVKSDQ